MEELPLLQDIAVIIGLSMLVLWASHRIKLPAVIGLLLTGLIAGPYGLGLITAPREVEHLAEIGVIFLLFAIGLEFSFAKLARIRRAVFLGGSLQAGLTILAGVVIAPLFGLPLKEGIFWGFLLALSSTAIVLRLLQESNQYNSPQGQTILAILIFQDLLIVPLILVTPYLAGQGTSDPEALWMLGFKSLVILILVVVSARWVVPWMLYRLVATRSKELFLLAICAIVLSVTWLTHWAGLSLGLGAFLAGLIISESEYSHHALANILPFRDVFSSFFFVSIGMLLDFQFFFHHLPTIGLILLGLIIIKALASIFSVLVLGLGIQVSVMTGLALAQIGEFSFILSKVGLSVGLLREEPYQYFLSASVASLALTPILLSLSNPLSQFLRTLPLPRLIRQGWAAHTLGQSDEHSYNFADHTIIAGFGLTGKILSKAAHAAHAPFVALEMNPETVRRERSKGTPILYGDAGREDCLIQAGIHAAKIVVLAINDPQAIEAAVKLIKEMNPGVWLIVRTTYVRQLKRLYSLGADEVIPAEYETAVEIFGRVLQQYNLPEHEIQAALEEARSDAYNMVRGFKHSRLDLKPYLGDHELMPITLTKESPLIGQTLAETRLRSKYQVTLLAIKRGEVSIPHPSGDERLLEGDHIVLLGCKKDLCIAANIIQATGHEEACRI